MQRHLKKRGTRFLAAATACALLVSACGSDSASDDESEGAVDSTEESTGSSGSEPADSGSSDSGKNELLVALPADPTNIHPNSTNQRDMNLAAAVNEKLFEFSVDGDDFEMILAESVEQIDDTTVEVVLKEGVEFTNGEPFNAQSAAYSLEVVMGLDTLSSQVSVLSAVEAVGDYTIRVTSDEPNPLMITAIALGGYQFPAEYHAEVGHEAFGEAPIGTGPYIFDEWNQGASIHYTANPDYWDGVAEFEKLTFEIVPDFDAQVAALESGQVDLVMNLPISAISRVESSDVARRESRPSNRIYYVTFNTLADTPLQDPAVRRALQHAVDVDSIIDIALDGHGFPLNGQILTPAFQGYNTTREPTPYDPDLTKQLLAEAGYEDGFEIALQYSQTNIPPVGELLAQQLSMVGLSPEQNLMEPGTFLTDLVNLELEALFYAGSLPAPDADFMYGQFETGFRYSYYSNPQIDELLIAERSTADHEARQAILDEMLEVWDEDPAYIPLFQGEDNYGVSNAVDGFTPRASQWIDWHEFTNAG